MKIKSIKKSYIQNVLSFLILLVTVLYSRTVYFGIVNRSRTQLLFFAVVFLGILFLGINTARLKKNILAVIPFCILLGINLLLNVSDMDRSQINGVIGYCLVALAVGIEAAYLKRPFFSCWYIRLIMFFCIISIPCFLLANFFPASAYALCQQRYQWPEVYGYSMFYTWGINGVIINRNSGPFWEPGAFQGFINIAILFLLLRLDEGRIKRRKLTMTVLLLTLLTTKSTTGYLIFVLMAFIWHGEILAIYGINNKRNRRILAVILCAMVCLAIFNSPVIQNKIGIGSDHVSTEMRKDDLSFGFQMMLKGGILGYGETNTRNAVRQTQGLIRYDSNGLVQLTYTFGWLVGALYIFLIVRMAKRLTAGRSKIQTFTVTVMFFILHMTEGLWSLPFYWLILLGV